MTITRHEAAQALGEIDAARGRVFEAKSYGHASPFLIIWGAVWMFADLAWQFAPSRVATYAWPVGVALGVIASIVAGFRLPAANADIGRRTMALWAIVAAFLVSLFLIVPVKGGVEIHSIFGVFFGFLYMGAGLWLGWRILALGAALAILTLIGFYEIRHWYALYMGLVSGGALILGGLWLRKV